MTVFPGCGKTFFLWLCNAQNCARANVQAPAAPCIRLKRLDCLMLPHIIEAGLGVGSCLSCWTQRCSI